MTAIRAAVRLSLLATTALFAFSVLAALWDWWLPAGLLAIGCGYLAGRHHQRRADADAFAVRLRAETHALAWQCAALEREKVERDEAVHLAAVDPSPPARRPWVDNRAGRSGTYRDFPARPVGAPSTNGAK